MLQLEHLLYGAFALLNEQDFITTISHKGMDHLANLLPNNADLKGKRALLDINIDKKMKEDKTRLKQIYSIPYALYF